MLTGQAQDTSSTAPEPGMTIDAAPATGVTTMGTRAQMLATPPPVPSASASRAVSGSSASFPYAGQQQHDGAGASPNAPGTSMAIDAASGATPMLAALEGIRLSAGSAATELLPARRRASGAASAHGGDMMEQDDDEETAAAPAPLVAGLRAPVPAMPVPVVAAGGAPSMGGTGSLLFTRQMSYDYVAAAASAVPPAGFVRPSSLEVEPLDTGRTNAIVGNANHHNLHHQTLAPPTPLAATALSLPHALAAGATIPVGANRLQPGGHLQVLQQQGSGIGSELTPVLLQQQQAMLPGAPVVGTAAATGFLPPPPLRSQHSFFLVAPRASPSSSTAVTPITARAPLLATPNAATAATGGATAAGPTALAPFAATSAAASAAFGSAAATATTTTTVVDAMTAAGHVDNHVFHMRSAMNSKVTPAAQRELVASLVALLCPIGTAAAPATSAGAPLSPRTASVTCRRVLGQVLAQPGIAALCAAVPECSRLAAAVDAFSDAGSASAALRLFCTAMPADVVIGALMSVPEVQTLLKRLGGMMAPVALAAAQVAAAAAAATVLAASQQHHLRMAATAAAGHPALFAHA